MVDVVGQVPSRLRPSKTALDDVGHHFLLWHVLVNTSSHGDEVLAVLGARLQGDLVSFIGLLWVGELVDDVGAEGLVVLEVAGLMLVDELVEVFVC